MLKSASSSPSNLALILLLQAAGVGLASPSVIVMPSVFAYMEAEWLPKDNQTLYHLRDGEVRRLELNRTERARTQVSITVSPCTRNLIWSIYHSHRNESESDLNIIREYNGDETVTFDTEVTPNDRYVLELRTSGGSVYCAVWARGEATRGIRLRLRRSRRRRVSASWDPSPIDPQATSYCVVASWRRPYTSLCAARYDLRQKNVVEAYHVDVFGNNRNYLRRRKFSRSTNSDEEDPIIECVGGRTHHMIDNLDSTKAYNIAIFGIGPGRVAGELQASGYLGPKYNRAQTLRDGVVSAVEFKPGEANILFKYKAPYGSTNGVWLGVKSCGGTVDIEVSVKGRVLYSSKNIKPFIKLHIQTPSLVNYQETSRDTSVSEGSSDSSEEYERLKYVIKITPNEKESGKLGVYFELVASENRWSIPYPELVSDEVREVRPARECNAVTIAFIPANHEPSQLIRYCLTAQEISSQAIVNFRCPTNKGIEEDQNLYCTELSARSLANHTNKVITRRIDGLQPGSKYIIRVSASVANGRSISYSPLTLYTNIQCSLV